MFDIQVIVDPAAATVALEPIRSRLLAELSMPASAATLATRVGLTRQKVNYHLNSLETHGLVQLAEERRWGGLTERLMVATAASYVVSPSAMGRVAVDPKRTRGSLVRELSHRLGRASRARAWQSRSAGERDRQTPRDTVCRHRSALSVADGPGSVHSRTNRSDRSARFEIEVRGTPEEVWAAIATGPGISSWFVPTDIEEQGGKPVAVHYHFGPGIDIRGAVTASDAPRTFVLEGAGITTGSPPVASEWTIEARAGGVCIIRIVDSLFASTDFWDNQLEMAMSGWSGFLSILKLYRKHFSGQPSAIMQVTAPTYPDGQGMVAMNIYMYGAQAREAVARVTPAWEAFFQQRFPTPGPVAP